MRSAMKHLARKNRHEHRVLHADEADQGEQQKNRTDGYEVRDVVPTLRQLLPHWLSRASRLYGRDYHGEQGSNDREITEAIDQEAIAFPKRRDNDSSNRGTEKSSHVYHRGVERNSVAEVGAVLDHLNHEGLARRHVESVDDALSQPEPDDFANGNDSGQGQTGQREGLQHRKNLRHDQGLVAIPSVYPDTRERSQKKTWYPRCKAHDAQQPRGAGYSVHQPTRGDLSHPSADQGHRLAGEEQAIVPRAQGPEGKFPTLTPGA